jgi:hypothetical protein
VEPFDAQYHGICRIEDDLMVILLYGRPDHIVIDQYARCLIRFPLNPDLNLPAMTVKVGAFTLVMEQTVTCVECNLFVNPGPHYKAYAGE